MSDSLRDPCLALPQRPPDMVVEADLLRTEATTILFTNSPISYQPPQHHLMTGSRRCRLSEILVSKSRSVCNVQCFSSLSDVSAFLTTWALAHWGLTSMSLVSIFAAALSRYSRLELFICSYFWVVLGISIAIG